VNFAIRCSQAVRQFAIGWRQVACGFVLMGSVASITTSYSVIAVPLAAEFHPSRTVLLLAMTLVSAVSAILSPLLGTLMDRSSLRRLIMIGALSLSAGFVTLSFARTFMQVLIVYGVLIAPANVLLGAVSVTVLLSRWFAAKRGTALGIAIAGVAMGGIVFPPMIQAFISHFPWREGVRLFAVVMLAITLGAALFVVNRPADRGLYPDGADSDPEISADGQPVTSAWRSIWKILSDPAFWMIFLMVGVVTSGMKGMITNLALLGKAEGFAPTAAALLISIYSTCGFLSKLGFAAIADRMNLRYLAVASLLGFSAGMLLLTQAHLGYLAVATGVGIIGLFGGLMIPLESMLGARVFGRNAVGRAVGLLSMVLLFALLLTPPLFGKIFDVTGSYSGAFYFFSGLALAAILIVPFVRLHSREVMAQDALDLAAKTAAAPS
jgi:MFS family permease